MNQFAPCPQCGGQAAEQMKFTWWGGVLGPKLLTRVKCPSCNAKYNGKTGTDNIKHIVIYSVAAAVLAFVLMFAVFFAVGFLVYLSNAK